MRNRTYAIVLSPIPAALLHPGDRVEIIGRTPDTGHTLLLTARGSVEYVDPSTIGADTPYNRHVTSCPEHVTRHSQNGVDTIEECDCGARFLHNPAIGYPVTLY